MLLTVRGAGYVDVPPRHVGDGGARMSPVSLGAAIYVNTAGISVAVFLMMLMVRMCESPN